MSQPHGFKGLRQGVFLTLRHGPNPAIFGPSVGCVPYTIQCPNPPVVGYGAPLGMRSIPSQPWHRPPWFNLYPEYPYPGMGDPYGMSSVPPSDMTNPHVYLFEDFKKYISEKIWHVTSLVFSLESNLAKPNSHEPVVEDANVISVAPGHRKATSCRMMTK